MSISLPNASTANTDSNATITADTLAAQTAFIASTTVLINQAIGNGFFQVEPFMVHLVTAAYITTYFQGLGYVVTFPIIPPGPWQPCFAPPGFPEVFPLDWVNWSCHCQCQCLPLRIKISWGP